jgi:hypothetical protein
VIETDGSAETTVGVSDGMVGTIGAKIIGVKIGSD